MASTQASYLHMHGRRIRRRTIERNPPDPGRISATRAPYIERSLFFGIKIDQSSALEEIPIQVAGTGESCFLIDREEKLERTVLQRAIFHDGKVRVHGDAIVGTKCGSIRHQHIVFSDDLDRIL